MMRPAAHASEQAVPFSPTSVGSDATGRAGPRRGTRLAAVAAALVLAGGIGAANAQQTKKPDLAKGQQIASQVCAACHGADGNAPSPANPKLAGQHADYLFAALKAYKNDTHATWGRSNGVMAGVAKQFSNAELKDLSKYLASLEGDLKVVPQSKFR